MAVGTRQLVGREQELVSLLGLLDTLPTAAVVVGEAGIGKTQLWLTAVEAAREQGFLVLQCRPSEAAARFSFGGLADLLAGVAVDVLPEVPGLQRRALEAALALADVAGPVDEGRVAFAFLSVVRRLAGERRILLAVDDVQWLDAPSLALLCYALPRLESEPVACLMTARDELPAWLRREALRELRLGPLSVGAVSEVLRGQLDVALPRPVLIRVWQASGGNPFFALELARALERRGRRVEPNEDLPLTASLEDLVHERLNGLGTAAGAVARVVAALADPTVALVAAGADGHAERGMAEALRAGLLELDGSRLRFAHPLLAAAVAARSTPGERRALHARLANVVPGIEERARHLALAAQGPSPVAASLLDRAAAAAAVRGAPTAAAELSEQALNLTPASDDEGRRRRTLLAAERMTKAGDSRRAVELLERALSSAQTGRHRAAVLANLAEPTWAVKGPREAVLLCEQALAEAETDDALKARIHLTLAEAERLLQGHSSDAALEHAERALAAARCAADASLTCKALATLAVTQFTAGRGVPRAELQEALSIERSLPGEPLTAATRAASWVLAWSLEDVEGARRHLLTYRETMRVRDDLEESEALFFLSLLEWRAGNWELAARCVAESLALGELAGEEGSRPVRDFVAATIAAHRGQIEEARARSEAALERAGELGIRISVSGHSWVLGFIAFSQGDPAGALEHLRRAWTIRDECGYVEPGYRVELGDTLEALVAVGELEEAERRLAAWDERARALDRAWVLAILARCRALLFAARGELDAAFAAFERALAEHGRSAYPFEHARTLLAFGATQRRAKRRAAARATLEQALAMFDELGASLWAAKTRTELARIGGRTSSRDELTDAERRIAALVAEGRKNREVAAALFLTEQTVATALTRVYRKLGVRSRAELASQLAREARSRPDA